LQGVESYDADMFLVFPILKGWENVVVTGIVVQMVDELKEVWTTAMTGKCGWYVGSGQ